MYVYIISYMYIYIYIENSRVVVELLPSGAASAWDAIGPNDSDTNDDTANHNGQYTSNNCHDNFDNDNIHDHNRSNSNKLQPSPAAAAWGAARSRTIRA